MLDEDCEDIYLECKSGGEHHRGWTQGYFPLKQSTIGASAALPSAAIDSIWPGA